MAAEVGTWQKVGGKSEARKKKKQDVKKETTSGSSADISTVTAFAALDKWRPAEPSSGRVEVGDDSDHAVASTSAPAAKPAVAPVPKPASKKPKLKKVKVSIASVASQLAPGLASTAEAARARYGSDEGTAALEVVASHLLAAFKDCELAFNKALHEQSLSSVADMLLSHVGPDFVEPIQEFVASSSLPALTSFTRTALLALLDGLPDGLHSKVQPPKAKVGLLLMVSLLLRTQPLALLPLSEDILAASPLYTSPGHLPVTLWVLAQASRGDPAVGAAVWTRALLPLVLGAPCGINPTKMPTDGTLPRAANASQAAILGYRDEFVVPSLDVIRQLAARGLPNPAPHGKKAPAALPIVPPAAVDALARGVARGEDLPATKAVKVGLEATYDSLAAIAAGTDASVFNFPELLRLSLDAANGAGEDCCHAVSLAAGQVAACLAADDACFAVWEGRHKNLLRGSSRVLAVLAAPAAAAPHSSLLAGSLAALRRSKAKKAALAATLRELRHRHRNALAAGKGWQGAASHTADDACVAMLRRLGGSGAVRGPGNGGGGAGGAGLAVAALVLVGGVATATVLAVVHSEDAAKHAAAVVGPQAVSQLQAAYSSAAAVAQPYVDQVAAVAKPRLDQAAAAVQPYVDHVAAVSKPYVERAAAALQPYVQQASVYASTLLQQAKGLA